MRTPKVLREAALAENVVTYHVLATGAALVFLFPLWPIILPITWLYYRRYYATLEVVLTTRELQVNRGVMIRQEKSIPLEKITDLAVVQGPIMRYMGLKGLQVETAGQSGAGSALVKIIGLANTDDFRDAALDQRDKVTERASEPTGQTEPGTGVYRSDGTETTALLERIHETLVRIEDKLEGPARPEE